MRINNFRPALCYVHVVVGICDLVKVVVETKVCGWWRVPRKCRGHAARRPTLYPNLLTLFLADY